MCKINIVNYSSQDFLTESYLFLTVGVVGGACADVVQEFHEVTKFEKREKLTDILQSCDPKDKTLVFVQTKKNADFIATHLSGEGLPTTSIHGKYLRMSFLWDSFINFQLTELN